MRWAGVVGLIGSAAMAACDATGPASEPHATTLVADGTGEGASTAPLGATLSPGPAVIALDAKDEPVANVVVRFVVVSGGGSITGAETRTDAQGRARVGSWTLGLVAGTQALDAIAGSARTRVPAEAANPCPVDAAVTLQPDVRVAAALEVSDCTRGERFADLYRLEAENQIAVRLVTSRTDLLVESAAPFASGQRVILPAGSYSLVVLGTSDQQKAPYEIEARRESESLEECAYVYALPGITTAQTLGASDCNYYGQGNFADAPSLVLRAGQTVTITMSSEVIEPALELWTPDEDLWTSDETTVNGGTISTRIVWTAIHHGEHVVIARNARTGVGGANTLSIQ